MTQHDEMFVPGSDDTTRDITKLAIMAVGGQGGGVLTNWIETLCRNAGRLVQATSVAGVAQRTGATIYYIEIGPEGVDAPIFSLAPSPGDVDILIAAELMEAGRAIQRGFVTPDRTTLIASTHRALAVSEKVIPGDGIAEPGEVLAAAEIAARRFLSADMQRLALDAGSLVSASLFGALAGSGCLPFPRADFEAAIRSSGKSVDANLAAFAAGLDAVLSSESDTQDATPATPLPDNPVNANPEWNALMERIDALSKPSHSMARAGLRKVVDFQDLNYGRTYLERVEAFAALDSAASGYQLTLEAAKYIANAMAYDDVIRVADRKTRGSRLSRIDAEMGRTTDQLLHITEYLHPRAEEIAGLLPAGIGAWVEAKPSRMAFLSRRFSRGRQIRSDRLGGFLLLYMVSGLRGYRPRTRRHAVEQEHLMAWLDRVRHSIDTDYELAVELLRCRRLIKGYSDTHARGMSKFDQVLAGAEMVSGRDDAADWVRRLRNAALQDEDGTALSGALATIRSMLPD